MEDPYLAEIISKALKKREESIVPTYLREESKCTKKEKEPLSTEIKGSYFFAKALDKFGKYHYLSADSEEAIEDYCEGGILGDSMAIEYWASNVDPIMVAFHYKWVGKRRNPFVIAKPIYKYEDGKYVGRREFKEKW